MDEDDIPAHEKHREFDEIASMNCESATVSSSIGGQDRTSDGADENLSTSPTDTGSRSYLEKDNNIFQKYLSSLPKYAGELSCVQRPLGLTFYTDRDPGVEAEALYESAMMLKDHVVLLDLESPDVNDEDLLKGAGYYDDDPTSQGCSGTHSEAKCVQMVDDQFQYTCAPDEREVQFSKDSSSGILSDLQQKPNEAWTSEMSQNEGTGRHDHNILSAISYSQRNRTSHSSHERVCDTSSSTTESNLQSQADNKHEVCSLSFTAGAVCARLLDSFEKVQTSELSEVVKYFHRHDKCNEYLDSTYPKSESSQTSFFRVSYPVDKETKQKSCKNECGCSQVKNNQDDETSSFHINSLPAEIMQKIFSYLPQAELMQRACLVCRQWYVHAMDPIHWQTLTFKLNHCITSSMLCRCLERVPLLRVLCLHGRDLTLHEMQTICTNCPLLQDLDIGFCDSLNYVMIECLVKNCCNLESLNIEGCRGIHMACIRALCELPKLCRVNLSHCTLLADDSIELLGSRLNYLERLNIDGIATITDGALKALLDKHCDHVTHLDVDGAELSDVSIFQVSRCPKIEHFGISFAELVTDETLLHLKTMGNLRELRLKKGAELSTSALCEFFQCGTMSRLCHLDLTECTHLEDDGIIAMGRCCGKTLKHLALCWCWNITDVGLAAILDHCRNLEFLDLLGLDKICGSSLERIPTDMSKLTYLDLRQCNRIIDELIVEVIKRKPDLTVLNYYGEEFRVFGSHEEPGIYAHPIFVA